MDGGLSRRRSGGRRAWHRLIAAVLLVVFATSVLAMIAFGTRTYRTLVLLQSAQALGAAEVGSIRAWMTLRFVADAYRVGDDALVTGLGLPADTDLRTSMRILAERAGDSPFTYTQNVQTIVAALARPQAGAAPATDSTGWLAMLGDRALSAVLVYGYPALSAMLFLGAIGAPLPTGLATTVAGSLAAQGRLSWAAAVAVVVTASILGDLVGYAIGRTVNTPVIERWGRWFGFTAGNRARVEKIFARWGGVTVFLTRTLVSHLSSIVSLLAGVNRYGLARFLLFASLGRLTWTAAYFGLGFVVGTNLEPASGFLGNLSFFLLATASAVAAAVGLRHYRRPGAGRGDASPV